MKLNERCSGQGFDSPHLHQNILDSDVAARSRDNFKDSLINCTPVCFVGDVHGFDRAISKDMDNTVGDDRKSSKIVTANAANDEAFALAA